VFGFSFYQSGQVFFVKHVLKLVTVEATLLPEFLANIDIVKGRAAALSFTEGP
jgi:hypothetical protein